MQTDAIRFHHGEEHGDASTARRRDHPVTAVDGDLGHYPFCLTLTRTGDRTHLGLDCPIGVGAQDHPAAAPGHPRRTLCGAQAVPLPPEADPWEAVGWVECKTCLHRSTKYMSGPGWSSLAKAREVFGIIHQRRKGSPHV